MPTGRSGGGHPRLAWVLDRGDDHRCVEALLEFSDPATGVLTVLAAPRAPWPVLAREVLYALGKNRAALAGVGRRRIVELAALWLRAERISHLVVLRAHSLPSDTLRELADLAEEIGLLCWAVAHGPAVVAASALPWPAAADRLGEARRPLSPPPDPGEAYRQARDLARRAGRTWTIYHEHTMKRVRTVREGTELVELLQPLTIDARDLDDLRLRLHATVTGLRDEGLDLAVSGLDDRRLRCLGPRFDAATVARLRRVACPVGAAALTVAQATDQDAPNLARTRREWTDPDGRHLRTTVGTFRIPPQARPVMRALLEHHATRPGPAPALFVADDGSTLLGRRIAHAVVAAGKVAGLSPARAGWAREKCYIPEAFAADFTFSCDLRPRPCH